MRRRPPRVRLLTLLTAAIAVAMAAGGIALALDRDHGGDHHPHLDTASGLLVTNRSELRLCVEAPPEVSATGRQAIQASLLAALQQTRQDPNWNSAYGRAHYNPATALDFGCPAPRLPQRYEPKMTVAGPGVTANPSIYRAWVYVLDEPTADRVLGTGQPTAVAAAELMAESMTAFPVSTALLVRQSRLADTATVVQGLRAALGLDPSL
ncbi:hypothetical protein [Catellatospora tritici]|uniref:hypothetical protein n=1 Tax=Catellatospora tritici TaxID=2851566 RepID=UPI001C2D923A|nr:hypothetical protein [Catellatospora tritici]MBV1856396.1 hypothetical protein [Catellatospora tritici]